MTSCIDIVITTFNRQDQVVGLVSALLPQLNAGEKIIIVDSGEELNTQIPKTGSIKYLKSSHQNQPFQRYLGYQVANAEYILFLDDDMEPCSAEVLNQLRICINKHENLAGIALCFKNKIPTSIDKLPKTNLTQSWIHKWRWISGYSQPKIGELGLCGIRGSQPPSGGYTQLVSGGAFVAKRDKLFLNFNFTLFSMFENKVGMGEDTIIGYTLSKQGLIWYEPEQLFWHHEKHVSNYSVNSEKLAKKVMYSRLFLSLEKYRLDNRSALIPVLHYHWFAIWRIIGLLFNLVIKYNPTTYQMLKGFVKGCLKATELLASSREADKKYWSTEMQRDLNNG